MPCSNITIFLIRSYGRLSLIILMLSLLNILGTAQTVAQTSTQEIGPVDFQKVLSWLPEDTETIMVARGPFILSPIQQGPDEDQNRTITGQELEKSFESLPLSLFEIKNGLLLPRLKGRQILLAVEAARHFRTPTGMGEMLYEGCAIAIFADDLNEDAELLIKDNQNSVLKVEPIEGQMIVVFQQKLEADTWTFYVAFPNKRMLVVATNQAYLKELLVRLQGKTGNRALPNDLPEWRYVDTELRSWGLRHLDMGQAKVDPGYPFTFVLLPYSSKSDKNPIGLTFAFDQSKGNVVTLTYLSGNKSLGKRPDTTPLWMGGPEEGGLESKYRELAPGVVEGTYFVKNVAQRQSLLFSLMGLLGHAMLF